jgi:hypothetical protein
MQIKGPMRHRQEGNCEKDNRKENSKEKVEILCLKKKSPSQVISVLWSEREIFLLFQNCL